MPSVNTTRRDRQEKPGQNTGRIAVAQPFQVDLVIGRSLAACAHPIAAWRVLSPRKRVVVPIVYFAVAYASVLVGLMAMSVSR